MPSPSKTNAQFRSLGEGRFSLSGRVSFTNAGALLADGESALRRVTAAEVDLSGITQADSAALAVLLEWVAGARRRGATLRYTGVPATLTSIARISDVEELLCLAESPPAKVAGNT